MAFANAFALGCGRKLQTIILDETWRVVLQMPIPSRQLTLLPSRMHCRTMTLVLQANCSCLL